MNGWNDPAAFSDAQRAYDSRQPEEEREVVDWRVVYIIEGIEEESNEEEYRRHSEHQR